MASLAGRRQQRLNVAAAASAAAAARNAAKRGRSLSSDSRVDDRGFSTPRREAPARNGAVAAAATAATAVLAKPLPETREARLAAARLARKGQAPAAAVAVASFGGALASSPRLKQPGPAAAATSGPVANGSSRSHSNGRGGSNNANTNGNGIAHSGLRGRSLGPAERTNGAGSPFRSLPTSPPVPPAPRSQQQPPLRSPPPIVAAAAGAVGPASPWPAKVNAFAADKESRAATPLSKATRTDVRSNSVTRHPAATPFVDIRSPIGDAMAMTPARLFAGSARTPARGATPRERGNVEHEVPTAAPPPAAVQNQQVQEPQQEAIKREEIPAQPQQQPQQSQHHAIPFGRRFLVLLAIVVSFFLCFWLLLPTVLHVVAKHDRHHRVYGDAALGGRAPAIGFVPPVAALAKRFYGGNRTAAEEAAQAALAAVLAAGASKHRGLTVASCVFAEVRRVEFDEFSQVLAAPTALELRASLAVLHPVQLADALVLLEHRLVMAEGAPWWPRFPQKLRAAARAVSALVGGKRAAALDLLSCVVPTDQDFPCPSASGRLGWVEDGEEEAAAARLVSDIIREAHEACNPHPQTLD